MAKAKLETGTIKPPLSPEAATGPVTDISSAVTGDGSGKALPAIVGDAATAAVGDSAIALHVEGTSEVVDNAGGGTDVSAINDAAFDQVMKRFVSQGKTVVVKGPEKGRWRAGRHFTIEPTSIPLNDLTEAELEKLCGDPLLTVAVVDAPY